jgi:hypothetical protein
MTISESPFAEGDFAVAGTITGEYTYDPAATPFISGPNFAEYQLLSAALSAGLNTWKTNLVRLTLAHGIGIELIDGSIYNPSDVYDPGFLSPIDGPLIGPWKPAFWSVTMVDTDASVYADLTFPVAFPEPDLFEVKLGHVSFIADPGERADVIAHVDSISVVPEPSSLTLVIIGALSLAGMGPLSRVCRSSARISCRRWVNS